MARSLWSGSLGFGLVNIPVRLFPAIHEHDVHFHQLAPDGSRIHYCLLYTSDAADDGESVDLGGRRIIKKIFF